VGELDEVGAEAACEAAIAQRFRSLAHSGDAGRRPWRPVSGGSLGAGVGFMVWLWISVVIVLLGGELNAQMEHQTARDTTEGGSKPLGSRGALMADHVGEAQI
jgi:hypothetical protein